MDTDYPSDWESRRKKVYERDDHKCQNCGRRGGENGNAELHAHHIVPKSKGGTHKTSNLISVCKQCHNSIHNDSNAPTTGAQTDLREFKNLLDRIMKMLKYIDQGVSVKSPGKLQNKKFERDRISLIQDLGKFTINYEAPDHQCEQVMDDLVQSIIELLRFPEDSWERLEKEDISRKETKEYGEKIATKRGEKISEEVNKFISVGPERFF